MLNDGTEMVFIIAGMGGVTGTGAAPVIANIAKEMGILTVGIVTIPFLFEGKHKILQALNGVEEMLKNADALLVINNERLRDIYGELTVAECFPKADEVILLAVKSIVEIITSSGSGYINLDISDVKTTLKDKGPALINSGTASGNNRITKAIENAIQSPLTDHYNVFDAKRILFHISSSESTPLLAQELEEIGNFISHFNSKDNIDVIWGAAIDESLGENVKVILLAAGF